MFDVTERMVRVKGWKADQVLPTLQTQLAAGVSSMGQSMSVMLAQNNHVGDMRARVVLTMSAMAAATAASGSGAAMRHEAAGSVRINGALQAAAEELGANSAAREAEARLGQLQQAASRDEGESPALREAASAAVTGEFGAQINLLIHHRRSSTLQN